MKFKERITEKLKKNAVIRTMLENYGVRTIAVTVGGAAINLLFAIFNGVSAIYHMSIWYGSIAGYYLVLSVQRLFVLAAYRCVKKKYGDNEQKLSEGKQKIYLANGAVIVPLAIALGVAATQMVLSDNPAVTGEIMAITSAAYACFKTVMAVRNFIKARRSNDLVIQTIRNIGFVDALVSVLVLETTLIPTFGAMDRDMRTIVAVSALVLLLFTIGLGSFMIVTGAKKLSAKKEKTEEYDG